MTGELDADEWTLAERLSMTRDELLQRMTNAEFVSWKALETYRAEMARLRKSE